MNQKKAKALRRLAKVVAEQNKDQNITEEKVYLENTKHRKAVVVKDKEIVRMGNDAKQEEGEKSIVISPGSISLAPNTQRSVYKKLKKVNS